jgi:two-component system response regulator RegA
VSAPAASILLVDDDETFRERLARALRERGHQVVTAGSAADGERAAVEALFQYAIVDLRMPGASGLELVAALKRRAPEMRVVVLTGYGSIASVVEAMHLGAHSYLSKPADADDVIAALTTDGARAVPAEHAGKPPTLARAEWEHIQRILADCGGNISEAARRLGITRRTLQLKLKKDPPRT